VPRPPGRPGPGLDGRLGQPRRVEAEGHRAPRHQLGIAEGASRARAAAGRSIRDALAAASGHEKEELEAAWRTFRAEQRGLLLLRTLSYELSMPRLLLAMSYELARWILVEVSPSEVGDTPLRALSMPKGPLARLVTGLRAAYDLPHEPRLRDLPKTCTELRELKGVGLKCEEELVAALMDHLADWRHHRAGLPPEQLRHRRHGAPP